MRLLVRAFGVLTAVPLAAQTPAGRPADLVHLHLDRNGFLVNPFWQVQETLPTSRPSIVGLCQLHRPAVSPAPVTSHFGNPDCSSQLAQISVESRVGKGLGADVCRAAAVEEPRFAGHLNWFPVTVVGQGSWLRIDPLDHDANLLLVPDPVGAITAPGLTSDALPAKGRVAYKLEFDSREVFEAITTSGASLPLWDRILARGPERAQLLGGKRYVAIGLYGLDGEHGYLPEIHPVWGLAVRVRAEQDQESWVIFARNSGNEGGCSSRRRLQLPVGALSFELPITDEIAVPTVKASFRNIFGAEARYDAQPDGRVIRLTIPFSGGSGVGVELMFGEIHVTDR